MKKILLSLLTVSAVAAVAFFGTRAFFSDTETSTGNTFTAGAVDLKIDSKCSYNGASSAQCGTWDEKDLLSEKFFNFADTKPGDYGENTISLHVIDNPAHACLYIENMVDAENGINEPESAVDTTSDKGELSSELHFFAWGDTNGDNVWNYEETPYFSNVKGPASDVLDGKVYRLPDLPADETTFLGVYWCYGDLIVDPATKELLCNGSAVTNASQTDSLTANLRFYVEQARHNEGFECPAIISRTFEYDQNSVGGAQNNANEPATNAYNQPYVTGLPVPGGVQLTFHNPTPWLFVFDVRVDGQGGVDRPGGISPSTIGAGPLATQTWGPTYQRIEVDGRAPANVHEVTRTFYGTDSIVFGMREGAERDWYIDWLTYNAVPQP